MMCDIPAIDAWCRPRGVEALPLDGRVTHVP